MEALLFLIVFGLGIALYSKTQKAKRLQLELQENNENINKANQDLRHQLDAVSGSRDALQKESEALAERNVGLTAEVLALEAFRPVLDAKREAERILEEARVEASEAQRHADLLRSKTEQEINQLLASATPGFRRMNRAWLSSSMPWNGMAVNGSLVTRPAATGWIGPAFRRQCRTCGLRTPWWSGNWIAWVAG